MSFSRLVILGALLTVPMLSMAASVSFYAYGSSDGFDNPDYLSQNATKSISINYSSLGADIANITSAEFWLKAVDDRGSSAHCTPNCTDYVSNDGPEQAHFQNIESGTGSSSLGDKEINAYGWYDIGSLNINDLKGSHTSPFTLTLKAIDGDFWFKNAKLVINTTAVPIPAAAWLFVSGLAGLAGFSNRRKIHKIS